MDQITILELCIDLENKYGWQRSNRMLVLETVGLFAYVLRKGESKRDAKSIFNILVKKLLKNY